MKAALFSILIVYAATSCGKADDQSTVKDDASPSVEAGFTCDSIAYMQAHGAVVDAKALEACRGEQTSGLSLTSAAAAVGRECVIQSSGAGRSSSRYDAAEGNFYSLLGFNLSRYEFTATKIGISCGEPITIPALGSIPEHFGCLPEGFIETADGDAALTGDCHTNLPGMPGFTNCEVSVASPAVGVATPGILTRGTTKAMRAAAYQMIFDFSIGFSVGPMSVSATLPNTDDEWKFTQELEHTDWCVARVTGN